MKNSYNRFNINKNKHDDDEGQYCQVFETELEAEDDVDRPDDYDFISREYVAWEKIEVVLQWCNGNIESKSEMTTLSVQIRDYLLSI